jgi:hypothetical protein
MSEIQLNNARAQQVQVETSMSVQSAKFSQEELNIKAQNLAQLARESDARIWKMQKDAAHGDAKIAIAGGKMQQQGNIKQVDMAHKHTMDAQELQRQAINDVNKKIKDDKEAELKALEIAAKLQMAKDTTNGGKDDGSTK